MNELKKYKFPKEKPKVEKKICGWFNSTNSAYLRMMLNKNVKYVMELGSWLGMSARTMADFAPNATVICIDHWKGSIEHQDIFFPELYETFLVNCWDYKDRIIPIKEESIVGMKKVYESGIKPELIYVDASHEYEDVKKDIQTAKKLFPDAVICGDDYNRKGVRQAVDENGNVGSDGIFWWYT